MESYSRVVWEMVSPIAILFLLKNAPNCTSEHPYFQKIFLGACPQIPLRSTAYAASRFAAGGLRHQKNYPQRFSGSAPDCVYALSCSPFELLCNRWIIMALHLQTACIGSPLHRKTSEIAHFRSSRFSRILKDSTGQVEGKSAENFGQYSPRHLHCKNKLFDLIA